MPHRQTNHMSRRNKLTRKLSLTKNLQELKDKEITNRMLTPKLNLQVSDYRVDLIKKKIQNRLREPSAFISFIT